MVGLLMQQLTLKLCSLYRQIYTTTLDTGVNYSIVYTLRIQSIQLYGSMQLI